MDNWATQLAEAWKEKKDVINIFGVIVYTDAHPHIKKVLVDDDYWKALDELSGPSWPIFTIRPAKGTYGLPQFPRGTIGMMVPVYKEPVENKQLVEAFGIRSTDKPIFVLFCQEDDGTILSHRLPLKDNSIEDAYASLKEAASLGKKAVDGLKTQNRNNAIGAYNAITQQLE